jgi:hypothetical protein
VSRQIESGQSVLKGDRVPVTQKLKNKFVDYMSTYPALFKAGKVDVKAQLPVELQDPRVLLECFQHYLMPFMVLRPEREPDEAFSFSKEEPPKEEPPKEDKKDAGPAPAGRDEGNGAPSANADDSGKPAAEAGQPKP